MSSSGPRVTVRLLALTATSAVLTSGVLALTPSASAAGSAPRATTAAPSDGTFIGPVALRRTVPGPATRVRKSRRVLPPTPVAVSPSPTPASSPADATTFPTASGFTALRTASFATGLDEWDLGGASVSPKGTAVVTLDQGYDGSAGARASIPEGSGNKYARTLWGNTSGQPGALRLGEGADFTYGMALYLPVGFHASMQSYFVPMRWDNYGVSNVSRSGLAMYSDGSIRLFRERDGIENQVNLLGGTTFRLSEGSWHWLEVRQKLSTRDGSAINELLVDGALIGRSTTANYYGEPVSAVRYGIVAIAGDKQTRPLTVRYDRAVLGTGRLGPLG